MGRNSTESFWKIKIIEAYRDYQPPVEIKKSINKLLSVVPERDKIGLGSIVLTNTGFLNHDRRRQKTKSKNHKVLISESLGLYHIKQGSDSAYIEIFVDNILQYYPVSVLRIPFFRETIIANTLYHEIGHHIHFTHAPEFSNIEYVANRLRLKLKKKFVIKKYWYLAPIIFLMAAIVKHFRKKKQKNSPHS